MTMHDGPTGDPRSDSGCFDYLLAFVAARDSGRALSPALVPDGRGLRTPPSAARGYEDPDEVVAMSGERGRSIDSIGELEGRRLDELVREEEEEWGDAALDRLIEAIADPQPQEPGQGPREPAENEFACRACHLIYSRSCLTDQARVLCRDCAALAVANGLRPREAPHVHRIHHPCPACGALVMVPERGEVSCGVICPSCRVRLIVRDGHLRLVLWPPG